MVDIITGDEHCRGKFKNIYSKIKDRKDIRYIICVGDYFDPYQSMMLEERISNFNEIIEIAKADKRVILFFGNHDMHYLIDTGDKSRIDYWNIPYISHEFYKNLELFHICMELNKDTVVSHAGVSTEWMKAFGFTSVKDVDTKLMNALKSVNKDEESDKILQSLRYYYGDDSGYGNHILQPPTWIRPPALLETDWKWTTQIVGHTRTDSKQTKEYFFYNIKDEINYDDLKFDGNVETIVKGNKKLIMVDTGENLDTYLEVFN